MTLGDVTGDVAAVQPPELLQALVRRTRQAGGPDSRVFQEALALLFDSVEVGQAAWSTLRHHEEKLFNDSE